MCFRQGHVSKANVNRLDFSLQKTNRFMKILLWIYEMTFLWLYLQLQQGPCPSCLQPESLPFFQSTVLLVCRSSRFSNKTFNQKGRMSTNHIHPQEVTVYLHVIKGGLKYSCQLRIRLMITDLQKINWTQKCSLLLLKPCATWSGWRDARVLPELRAISVCCSTVGPDEGLQMRQMPTCTPN